MSESETNKPKISQKSSKTKGFYYSFLTLVLLFCLIQIGFGAILNISKTIAYRAKILTLTKIRDAAEEKNENLKSDIKLFSATSSLEGIARNNLKMAGDKEVLVIINQNQNTQEDNSKKRIRKNNYARNLRLY